MMTVVCVGNRCTVLVLESTVPATLGYIGNGMVGRNTTIAYRCRAFRGIQVEYLEGDQHQQQVDYVFKATFHGLYRVLKRKANHIYCPVVFN